MFKVIALSEVIEAIARVEAGDATVSGFCMCCGCTNVVKTGARAIACNDCGKDAVFSAEQLMREVSI